MPASSGESLLSFTEKALEMARVAREREGGDPVLRVGVVGSGCCARRYQMTFEQAARADDLLIERDGLRIVVDPASLEHLAGATIDWVAGLRGAGFKVNVPSRCGCGR